MGDTAALREEKKAEKAQKMVQSERSLWTQRFKCSGRDKAVGDHQLMQEGCMGKFKLSRLVLKLS